MKNSEKARDLPSLVRLERKAHGLQQKDLAMMASVGINLVSQLEGGRQTIRLDKLQSILDQLGITLIARRGEHEVVISKPNNNNDAE